MFCSNCGNENMDNASFCTKCGAPLHRGGQGNQGDAGYQQERPYGYQSNPGYQNNTYGRPPMPPIRKRSIPACIILQIVTCGLYGLYWLSCLANDVNEVSEHRTDTTGGMVVLFSIITCGIYLIYWAYVSGGKMSEAKQKYEGRPDDGLKILYLILVIFGLSIVQFAMLQNELNKISAYQ